MDNNLDVIPSEHVLIWQHFQSNRIFELNSIIEVRKCRLWKSINRHIECIAIIDLTLVILNMRPLMCSHQPTRLLVYCVASNLLYILRSLPRSCPTPVQPPLPPSCTPIPVAYLARCGLMNDTVGPFGSCVRLLNSTVASSLTDSCLMDACYSSGASICKSVVAFVDECRRLGVDIACDTFRSTQCGKKSRFDSFHIRANNRRSVTSLCPHRRMDPGSRLPVLPGCHPLSLINVVCRQSVWHVITMYAILIDLIMLGISREDNSRISQFEMRRAGLYE